MTLIFQGLIFFLCFFISSSAHAFTMNTSSAASFSERPIKIFVTNIECENNGTTPEDLVSMLGEAISQYWNKAVTSSLKLEVAGLITKSDRFGTDSLCQAGGAGCRPNPDLQSDSGIIVSCNQNASNFPSTGILGITAPNNVSGRQIRSSLVLINDIPGSSFGDRTRSEQVAILAHEVGHALGLGHSPVKDSLMFFQSIPTRRSLGQDDLDGITYLYPQELGPSACGSLSVLSDDEQNRQGLSFLALLILCLMLFSFTKRQTKFLNERTPLRSF